MLKIWKMAADFQNVYRCNASLCSSVVLADVSDHNEQPCRWKRITFCGRYLCFSFTCMIRDSGVLPSELHCGKKFECWFLGRNVEVAATKRRNCRLLLQTKPNFSSRPIKRLARQEVQPGAMFLVDMICTQTPAHWHLKIPIKWYGSIYFVSLLEKSAVPFVQKKATENSIQMVNAQCGRA